MFVQKIPFFLFVLIFKDLNTPTAIITNGHTQQHKKPINDVLFKKKLISLKLEKYKTLSFKLTLQEIMAI